MPLKAIFFDIDGTLVDSNEFHVQAWDEALHDHGHRVEPSQIRNQIGKGADQLLPALIPDIDAASQKVIAERHSEIFRTRYLTQVKPFARAKDLVEMLHNLGKAVLLASSAEKAEVDHYVELLKVGHALQGIVSKDDVKSSKPAGDIFAAALALVFPVSASQALAIGDTPYDVESALKSGLKTLALRSGGFSDEVLCNAGAAYVFASVKNCSTVSTTRLCKMPEQRDTSKRSIYAALIGNVAVAAIKLGAFFISGSASMLVEAFHSIIDTVNQGLLLLGLRLSGRPPDRQHPFGYGMDSFFWTFVVGMLIFSAGGVASIYEGIEKLRHPEHLNHLTLTLFVLGLSFVFETISFIASWRESERGRPHLSRRRNRRVTLAQFIHFSPDPGVFEVLAEGIASLIGLILAVFGVIGSAVLGWPWADGAAAIAIGVLLVALAGIVLAESKSLLTGEAVSEVILDGVRDILAADPRVSKVGELLSMYLGPEEILLAAKIDFNEGISGQKIGEASDAILARLREVEPRITRLFLRADGN